MSKFNYSRLGALAAAGLLAAGSLGLSAPPAGADSADGAVSVGLTWVVRMDDGGNGIVAGTQWKLTNNTTGAAREFTDQGTNDEATASNEDGFILMEAANSILSLGDGFTLDLVTPIPGYGVPVSMYSHTVPFTSTAVPDKSVADPNKLTDSMTVGLFDLHRLTDTLSYDANSADAAGTVDPHTSHADEAITIADNGFELTGSDFLGWNTRADGSGDSFVPGDEFNMVCADTWRDCSTTLYAQWKAQPVVTPPPSETSGVSATPPDGSTADADGAAVETGGDTTDMGSIGLAVGVAALALGGTATAIVARKRH